MAIRNMAGDKKTYSFQLDENSMDALDRWLKAAGMSRSQYINTLICKSVDAMGLKKIPDYSKITLPQLFGMVGGIGKLMESEKKSK